MKKIVVLSLFGTMLAAGHVCAQKMNTDSLKLAAKISSDQLKLGKLQNQVEEKTKDKQETAARAQTSADENQKAASDLSSNPQDKGLARKANHKASQAQRDARRAREAAGKLDDLNKDIRDMKDKIAKEQDKLKRDFPPAPTIAAPIPAVTDSTQH
jgi:hypothetical protein